MVAMPQRRQHHFGPAREQRGGHEGADEKTPETQVIHGDSAGERSFPHHAMLYIMIERIQVTF
jgi:hypothetical protein